MIVMIGIGVISYDWEVIAAEVVERRHTHKDAQPPVSEATPPQAFRDCKKQGESQPG